MGRHAGSAEIRKQAARRRAAAVRSAAMRPRARGKRRRTAGWHEPGTLASIYERSSIQ